MQGINFVYDIAFELEDDLKELSNTLGKATTIPLIHKIVNVLEKLEQHSQLYEMKTKQILELKESIKRLESTKVCKEQEKINHQKELERMEEAWRVETRDLLGNIERMEVENDNLKDLIQGMSRRPRSSQRRHKMSEGEEIKGAHLRLKETIDGQVEEIKYLKKDISQKCLDIDAMQQQCLNLSNVNAEICENYCHSKLKAKKLLEEKTSLEARLFINSRTVGHSNNADDVFIDQSFDATDGAGVRTMPNVHQFSWEEVKGYLQERDRLRSEVTVRTEQLLVYKPRTYDDWDADVQGPINKEPSDKVTPLSPKELGIKKFFQRLVPMVKQ